MMLIELVKVYVKGVMVGKIIVGEYIWLVCQWFFDDLKCKGVDWLYKYDVDKVDCVVCFMEKMLYIKGKWVVQKKFLVLEFW